MKYIDKESVISSPNPPTFTRKHYGDVIMSAMASKITSSRLFTQPFIRMQVKENIRAPRHWPL